MVVEETNYHQANGNSNSNSNNLNHNKNNISINIKNNNNKMNATSIMDFNKIGRTIKTAIIKAQDESRVVAGLSASIKVLSKAPEGSLFCIMAVPKDGDSATHMHEVLLEAFCYENDIYVIKVDCATKLSRILGKNGLETCCLIQKTWTGDQNEEQLNKAENFLVDFCEAFWDSPQHPVVMLPDV